MVLIDPFGVILITLKTGGAVLSIGASKRESTAQVDGDRLGGGRWRRRGSRGRR